MWKIAGRFGRLIKKKERETGENPAAYTQNRAVDTVNRAPPKKRFIGATCSCAMSCPGVAHGREQD